MNTDVREAAGRRIAAEDRVWSATVAATAVSVVAAAIVIGGLDGAAAAGGSSTPVSTQDTGSPVQPDATGIAPDAGAGRAPMGSSGGS